MDEERDAIAGAWIAGAGQVTRLGRFWEPPESLSPESVRVYGNDTFCLVLEQKLNLKLISPPDDFLLTLDAKGAGKNKRPILVIYFSLHPKWLNRSLWGKTLKEMSATTYPIFAKPAAPKLFCAGVFSSWQELAAETKGLEPDTAILTSEIVEFDAEVRSFVRGDKVLTHALYEGNADLEEAGRVLREIASTVPLPATCVLDLGHIVGRGWGIVEANASWGAGLNGCDPCLAAQCIAAATQIAIVQ